MADVNDAPVAPVEDATPVVEDEAAAEPEEASPEVEAPAAEEPVAEEPSAPESTADEPAEVVENGVAEEPETNGVEEHAVEEEKPAEEVAESPKGAKRGRKSRGDTPSKKPKVATPGGRVSSRLKNQESGTKLAKEISSDNLPNRRKSRGAVADEA